MKTQDKIRTGAIFIWVGFICAISFMEAWIKFTTPGVTINTGLAIGRRVFDALNKVEIALAFIIIATLVQNYPNLIFKNTLLMIAFCVLAIQSLYLLPQLSARIDLHLKGDDVAPSPLHAYYLSAEGVKVFSLLVLGFKQL